MDIDMVVRRVIRLQLRSARRMVVVGFVRSESREVRNCVNE